MDNNNLTFLRIAKMLIAEKETMIPRVVFDDIVSKMISNEGVSLISKRPNRGCFEVNGLMSTIRRAIKPIQRLYKNYNIDLDNNSASERKRCLISIRPILPSIPDRAKAKYNHDGVARFVDGPFKGEEVVWSSRVEDSNKIINEVNDDVFIIEPDKYRATFYGWKKKY